MAWCTLRELTGMPVLHGNYPDNPVPIVRNSNDAHEVAMATSARLLLLISTRPTGKVSIHGFT